MKRVLFGGVPGMKKEDREKMRRYVLEEAGDIDFVYLGEDVLSKEELLEKGKGAEVLISWDQEMDEELYRELGLKAYCAASIGFNAANVEAAKAAGVYVTNVPDYCTHEVAEHTITLLLSLYRRLFASATYVKEGNWDLSLMTGIRTLRGSTLSLLGFGRIPKMVAEKLKGFGLRIFAYDPFVSKEAMEEYGVEKVELEEAFKEADYLSLHSPLLDATYQMVNRERLALMKPSAFIINTARGALIDEEALYDALVEGRLAGVGLDVLVDEPPSEMGRKIIALPHALVTPHSAYVSEEASDLQIRTTAINVAKILRGETPMNLCV